MTRSRALGDRCHGGIAPQMPQFAPGHPKIPTNPPPSEGHLNSLKMMQQMHIFELYSVPLFG